MAILLLALLGGFSETSPRAHERWIWTELIGLDNRQPDLGVGEYLERAGFTPKAICLLMGTPDFVLSYAPIAEEKPLAVNCCSRDGHEFNRQRPRQIWSNYQLRSLIRGLHERGVEVYVTVFTGFYRNRFEHEWLSDHREVFQVWRKLGFSWALNPLARLADGRWFEDYFAAQLVALMKDYGFDGWHGADGWGPTSGPIYEVSFSDDMIDQFARRTRVELPAIVTQPCANDLAKLQVRGDWIWQHARGAWIEFYADRWAGFWGKMVGALHKAGKKAVINSAWGRAPFESLYRYGIDYRKIVATGVDGIIVETVAAGLAMDPRLGDADRHYDFLSMLMLIKGYVPQAKLIFLHNTHDVVEQWDALRHMPALLEREIYSLANVFRVDGGGKLHPAADGFLVCLGDGISRDEWAWLRQKWALAFAEPPRRTLGATLVWSDAALASEIDSFIRTRNCFGDRLLAELMARGAPIQSVARTGELANLSGPLVVLNPQLFPPQELAAVRGYRGGPIVAVEPKYEAAKDASLPADLATVADPRGYWDSLICRGVSEEFLRGSAAAISGAAGSFAVLAEEDSVNLMVQEQPDGTLRVAIKNKTPTYARPTVDLRRPIESIEVLTHFPSVLVRPQGSRFTVRVPGKGITVLGVKLK